MLSSSQDTLPVINNQINARRRSNFFPSAGSDFSKTCVSSSSPLSNLNTPQEKLQKLQSHSTSLDSSPFLANSSNFYDFETLVPSNYTSRTQTSMSESASVIHSPVMLSTSSQSFARTIGADFNFSTKMSNLALSGSPQLINDAKGFVEPRNSFSTGSGVSTSSISSIGSTSIWNDMNHSSSTILGNSLLFDLENDYLYSPFWGEDEENSEKLIKNEEEEQPQDKATNNFKKQNIYSNKVKNPVFIPSTISSNLNDDFEKSNTVNTGKENYSRVRHSSYSEHKTKEEEQIKINLPDIVRDTPRSDYFLKNILSSQQENKYSEDYCSTFYKRNNQGYMFIKEPSNSLKVNSTGGKSWVNLKVSLPDGNNNLLSQKLKVDVNELLIWKPLNSGGGGIASFPGRRRSSGNNSGNTNKITPKGVGTSRDIIRPKNGNLSKRFGRKSTPREPVN